MVNANASAAVMIAKIILPFMALDFSYRCECMEKL